MKIEKILKEAVSVLLNEYDKQQEEIKRYKIIIEKQQKEIQKLEARKYMFNAETGEITQIPIDNNYINKNKIKEKIADEMFEELGYSISDGIENFYTNVLIAGKKQKDISFDDVAKDFITIYLTKYNEYGNLETNQIVLSVKELQAINKKCQELGWI